MLKEGKKNVGSERVIGGYPSSMNQIRVNLILSWSVRIIALLKKKKKKKML